MRNSVPTSTKPLPAAQAAAPEVRTLQRIHCPAWEHDMHYQNRRVLLRKQSIARHIGQNPTTREGCTHQSQIII